MREGRRSVLPDGRAGGLFLRVCDVLFSNLFLTWFMKGFFFDFGEVLEPKMAPKIDFCSDFLDILLEPSF